MMFRSPFLCGLGEKCGCRNLGMTSKFYYSQEKRCTPCFNFNLVDVYSEFFLFFTPHACCRSFMSVLPRSTIKFSSVPAFKRLDEWDAFKYAQERQS